MKEVWNDCPICGKALQPIKFKKYWTALTCNHEDLCYIVYYSEEFIILNETFRINGKKYQRTQEGFFFINGSSYLKIGENKDWPFNKISEKIEKIIALL